MGMSFTNLNNEDYFSDHPKRLPSFDALFRAQAPLSPEHFCRKLHRQAGDNHYSQDDYQRAVFLFRRLQSARRTISKLISFFVLCRSRHSFALNFLKNVVKRSYDRDFVGAFCWGDPLLRACLKSLMPERGD
jgi:hypothetical protein